MELQEVRGTGWKERNAEDGEIWTCSEHNHQVPY